ncbi:alpha/beta hydrolase-fold protein [Planococcus sp. N028]|uniref:Alpha/beta hydrolase-fold protein n=1 Tax=Planococcus shixiaomingii TaxID=3058393 RepID=A0ABT8N3S3_9BACL|nr:alpha/beta hydrolase-fold protein [Planococcus sp. N028]MDN7242531.1 alpha/beta hydrolase-fold protein [Planococcus sp. N028]
MKRSVALIMIVVMLFGMVGTNSVFAQGKGSQNGNTNGKNKQQIELKHSSYQAVLPAGYNANKKRAYPVIYVMPEDGTTEINQNAVKMAERLMKTDASLEAILILTAFDEEAELVSEMKKLVADVDARYKTIPASDARAVFGIGTGGYMAYILGLHTLGADGVPKITKTPDLFGAIASVRGNFVGEDNIWYKGYGSVHSVLNGFTAGDLAKFYTYLDAPTEDSWTSMSGSTGDLGRLFIGKNAMFPYSVHEFTARHGSFDDAFLTESMNRTMDRLSDFFTAKLLTGSSFSLSPQALPSEAASVTLSYDIAVKDSLQQFSKEKETIWLNVTMTDPDSNEILHSEKVKQTVTNKGDFKGELPLPNRVNDINTNVELTVTILGKEISLGTRPIVRIKDTGPEPENQLVDLMGDWKFNAYKPYNSINPHALDNIDNVTEEVWTSWQTVQPALGWWNESFAPSLEGNANWTGYAWYVRNFDLPEKFATEGLLLALGKFDEADVVYINGKKVGATGIREDGTYDGSNPWDVDRLYDLDSSLLNYGGTNTIAVRMANSSGGGGWYAGPVGIYSPAAYNKVKGLPYVVAPTEVQDLVAETVAEQKAYLEALDIKGFASTVDPEYFQNGYDKARLVNEMSESIKGASSVSVEDSVVSVFVSDDKYMYQADRKMTVDGKVIETQVQYYFVIEDGKAVMYGDHERFFTDTFSSKKAASASRMPGMKEVNYRVYLPPGYFEGEERYPVVYLLHQFNSTSKSYEIDGVHTQMDEGIASGELDDMILVIPDSSATSFWRGDWEDMVTDELIPLIDTKYRTIDDARYRATAGASMGGVGAYSVGLQNPDYFTGVASFFGAFAYGGAGNPVTIANNVSAEYLKYFSHYFNSGNRDVYGFGREAIQLDQILRSKGVDHYYFIENGEHDSAFYIPFFKQAMAYTSRHRFDTKGAIAQAVSGSVEVATREGRVSITGTVQFDDEIASYLNTIPASKYTMNQNPDLVIPVTVYIEQNGKRVAAQTEFYSMTGAGNLDISVEVVSADLDLEQPYSVKVMASVLDTNVELGNF